MKAIFLEGSPDEISRAAKELGLVVPQTKSSGSVPKASNGTTNGTTVAQKWSERAIDRFVDYIWGNQIDLVKFILREEERATKKSIMKHFKFTKGQQLAGVLSGMTRNAIGATNDDEAKFILSDWNDAEDDYVYFIDPEALDLIKKRKPPKIYQ